MGQIKEDYVSFETAKLLKEKGFDWIVTRSFFEHDNCYAPCDPSEVPRKDAIAIPTLQMAMKWLREEHNKITVPGISLDDRTSGTINYYIVVYGIFLKTIMEASVIHHLHLIMVILHTKKPVKLLLGIVLNI